MSWFNSHNKIDSGNNSDLNHVVRIPQKKTSIFPTPEAGETLGDDIAQSFKQKIDGLESRLNEFAGVIKDLTSIIKSLQDELKKPSQELDILRQQTSRNNEFIQGIVSKLINTPPVTTSQVVEKIVEKEIEVEADYTIDDALTKFTPEQILEQIPLRDIITHGKKRSGRS